MAVSVVVCGFRGEQVSVFGGLVESRVSAVHWAPWSSRPVVCRCCLSRAVLSVFHFPFILFFLLLLLVSSFSRLEVRELCHHCACASDGSWSLRIPQCCSPGCRINEYSGMGVFYNSSHSTPARAPSSQAALITLELNYSSVKWCHVKGLLFSFFLSYLFKWMYLAQ